MRHQVRRVFTLSLLAAQAAAMAEGLEVKLDTTLSLGTTVRTTSPDPGLYAYLPSTMVAGAAPGVLTGQTGGSDLNFRRGRPVSTVAQAMFDLTLREQGVGLFLRGAAWHDFTLGHQSAGFGNYPNGYTPGAPLSDHGFLRDAKFDGATLRDAYLFYAADLGDQRKIDLRLGRLQLDANGTQAQLNGSWGGSRLMVGGIGAALNPHDYAAQLRPGALPEEARVPEGMLSLHLVSGKQWSVDAFLPFEVRQPVLPGCGTFFDIISVAPTGCALGSAIPYTFAGTPVSTINSLTERSLLVSGLYLHRLPDELPTARGEYGLAGHWVFENLRTEIGVYALNTAATLPSFRVRIDDVNGAPVKVALPGQAGLVFSALQRLNPWVSQLPASLSAAYTPPPAGQGNGLDYGVSYPKSVHLLGLSFNTELSPATRLYGELAHRSNQPLSYNLNDVLNALLLRTPNSLLAERRNVLAVKAGEDFDTYERFGVTTASVGASQVWLKTLGAAQLRLSAEVGLTHVNGLPDPNVVRFGRSFAYGSAPYLDSATSAMTPCAQPANGAGLYYAPGKTCTTDGFVTPTAWGWRVAVAGVYPNALLGATLVPSLLLADDVHGYTYDGSFSQGRTMVRPALRASWTRGTRSYYADVAYTHMGGGRYNLLADRSNLSLAVGLRF